MKTLEHLQTYLDRVRDVRDDVYSFLSSSGQELRNASMTIGEHCDYGYLCSQLAKIAEDLRKDANAFEKLASTLMVHRAVTDPNVVNSNEEDDEDLVIRGDRATARVKIKVAANRPQFGTKEHAELLAYFGVTGEPVKYVKVDWKQLERRITTLLEEGKPLPPGIGKTFDNPVVTYRKKGRN